MANVLQEILNWSVNLQLWQRDALRRLIVNGELTEGDILELTEICKGNHGLVEKIEAQPLSKEHVPEKKVPTPAVSLESICHHKGVNALAENQTLKFHPGLTIVYGDNGAGKTGYVRIFKKACRARRREEILGNVISGTVTPTPEVTIKYKIGNETDVRQWDGGDADEFVSRVSIFDAHCAAVYLNDKTDVAFRPFGLDLFDKLVKACKSVRSKLASEQGALNTNAVSLIVQQIPVGTNAHKIATNINSLTKPEDVQIITRLKQDELDYLSLLEKSLQDMQANDPSKLISQLELRARRVSTLADHLQRVESVLADTKIEEIFEVRKEGRAKNEEAKRLREKTFPKDVLLGTGGDQWKSMWESSRLFSEQQAYQDENFPFTGDDAKCVLCQQNFDHMAVHRLRQFEDFFVSTTEQELKQIREDFSRRKNVFISLNVITNDIIETIEEIRLDHATKADVISSAISQNENRRSIVVSTINEDKDLSTECPALISASQQAQIILSEIETRIKSLQNPKLAETRQKLSKEVQELRARELLGKYEQTILDEIESKKKYAVYSQCIEETKTNAITQKSSEVAIAVISTGLKNSFKEELKKLEFRHVEVELKEQGGTEGVFYHKLVLTRNPTIEVPRVVSEGEQRCISIAAFFAELSTADDPSAIIFDDPVSSLDFQWRSAVAKRLVDESQLRQVVVFTHDIVFLLALKQFAEKLNVDLLDQHVQRQSSGAGICVEELPWVAMKVKDRLGYLKNRWQAADKLFRDDNKDAYENEAKDIYDKLRTTWERAIEEILLNGIIERYRPSIETKKLKVLSDITDDDCMRVEKAMTKCSAWIKAHDHAPAAYTPVPGSQELKQDIDTLETWISALRPRRK